MIYELVGLLKGYYNIPLNGEGCSMLVVYDCGPPQKIVRYGTYNCKKLNT